MKRGHEDGRAYSRKVARDILILREKGESPEDIAVAREIDVKSVQRAYNDGLYYRSKDKHDAEVKKQKKEQEAKKQEIKRRQDEILAMYQKRPTEPQPPQESAQ